MKTLISIVGTTGIGKTKLAIELAKRFTTEIISCDSRQFFKEMNIGTATPSDEELAEAKHHFIGHLSIRDYYSIGQYEMDALKKLDELFENYNSVILVGGSMMYEKAVIEGLNELPEASQENQEKLEAIWQEEGLEKLQYILENLDPRYFKTVDKDNPRRLLRAIDVIWQTKKKYSDLISEPKSKRNFRTIRIGLDAPREIIYERINQRVDKMLEQGLEKETKELHDLQNQQEKPLIPLQTVGYTEFFNYFNGIWDKDFAISEIKKNSRRFAKRQLTWYRKEENIYWLPYDYNEKTLTDLLKTIGF